MMLSVNKSLSLRVMRPLVFAALLSALVLPSCKPDDPDEGEEEITTMTLDIVNSGTGVSQTVTFRDGQSVPSIQLAPNATFVVTLSFLNENVTPAENITLEVQEEADEHLVCFTLGGNVNMTVARNDKDPNGLDLGLVSTWTTGAASDGNITVELRHQPGVKDGSCSPGESDVEVNFPLSIR